MKGILLRDNESDLPALLYTISYFIVNSGLAVVWMIGILALAVKISFNFNLTYIILSISAFIISFCSIIFGILRIKRKKSND